jgi:pyruvate/2-oxoglutarate dehydrogenase complex dihydrolipoamide acyltransferase (E2) component
VAALLVSFGSVDEYAEGPAVVRAIGETALVSHVTGTVGTVRVSTGGRVADGQVVAEIIPAPREGATSEEVLQVQAPSSGSIGEVVVRAGERIDRGDVVAFLLAGEHPSFELLFALPGRLRPLLKEGARAQLELDGFPSAVQDFAVDHLGADLLPAREAQRVLGLDSSENLEHSDSTVIGRATLSAEQFVADSQRYPYYTGMKGVVRVRVKRSRIAALLFPWTRALLGRN